MITLEKIGDAIKFTFSGNTHYLQDGTVEVPVNSLSLTIDGSEMVTFKKSATNDIFLSATYGELGMTKDELIAFYKENMVDGGGSDITSGDVQSMIDESISGKADSSAVTESINAAVSGKVDSSAVTSSVTSASTDSQVPSAKAVYDAIQENSGSSYTAGEGIVITGSSNAITLDANIYKGNGLASVSANNPSGSGNGYNKISGMTSFGAGWMVVTKNVDEAAFGYCNKSNGNSDQFTHSSGSTLFSVGNGTNDATRHNAFEIRQNGDIYITSGGTDIKLQDALGGGGGKAIEAGRGISITTGETADTVSFNLPISAGTGSGSIKIGTANAEGSNSLAVGNGGIVYSDCSLIVGSSNYATSKNSSALGEYLQTKNNGELAVGNFNNSTTGSTLFSVGNGTAVSRHNAFEVRQNGDIYITSGGTDIKLQDNLGGGGSINVVQTTGTSTTDVMSQNAVTTKLSGYVTTDTAQIITGKKTFKNAQKAIEFKQLSPDSKAGFTITNSGTSTTGELASFEFRPNTFTIDGVSHPLMYFGHYRTPSDIPQTVIGFRQYDSPNAAAYHYLLPLPEKAKTPFNLTTTFKEFYAPMGFKNGSSMITADDTGVVDLSSELDGLKLKKLTQAEYDALVTKDSNVLYVIVG